MWQEPIFDRTNADTLTARAGQSNIDDHKGALNYQDLNRIEGNFQYVVRHLFANAMVIPHTKRAYAETTYEIINKEVEEFPEGCTRLAYIESTGTQYIDTGFNHNQNTRVVMRIQANKMSSIGWVFGARNNGTSAVSGMFFYYGGTNKWGADYSSNSQRAIIDGVGETELLNIDFNENVLTVNSYTKTFTAQTFQCNYPLTLFALNDAGTTNYLTPAKLYSCQVYDNGTLVRDYIPVLDWTGVACLYDKVTRKFYYNAGTGSFEYTIPVELPEGYTQVSYIQSGGTQYIDAGFKPSSNTRILADMEVVTGGTNALFGARNNSSANSTSYSFTVFQISGASLRSDFGSVESSVSVSPVQRLRVDKNANVTTVNGKTVTATAQSFQCSYNLTIFSVNTGGTVNTSKASAKLYSFKVYEGTSLIRDFIPCTNPSGVAGLYDLVDDVFYENKGTGEFSKGDAVQFVEGTTDFTYELEEITTTYTDWQEQNIPWLSEIDRIRQNFNNLIALFLRTLDLPTFPSNVYLMYSEVNDWERVSLVGKTMFENMEKEYVYSGTIDSGGERLL